VTSASRTGLLAPGTVLLAAAYPVAVYFLLDRGDVRLAGLLLIAVLVARLFLPASRRGEALALLAVGALFATGLTFTGSELMARLWPVAVSAAMLAAFAATLARPPSMIERIARATGADLDAPGVRYTRTVTVIWCGFFVANGALAFATAIYASREWWVLYNGLISYLIAGGLLVGERLIRPHVQRRLAATAGG
jgi:uncharacterized membrane protein